MPVVWNSSENLQMFISFCFSIFVFGQVDILISYDCNTQYWDFIHCQLNTNNIVCIFPLSMEKNCSSWIVSCGILSDVLNEFRITLLYPSVIHMYSMYIPKVYMTRRQNLISSSTLLIIKFVGSFMLLPFWLLYSV